MRRLAQTITLLACLTAVTSAQNLPTVTLLRTDGTETRVTNAVSFENETLVLEAARIPLSKLVRIDFDNRVRPARSLVCLTNGDQLPLAVDSIDEESLVGRYRDQAVRVPLEFIRAIAFQLPETDSARRQRLCTIRTAFDEDTIQLLNGDQVVGELQAVSPAFLTVESATGQREIPRRLVATIHFSAELQSPTPTKGRMAVVQTTDDLILSVTQLKSTGDGVTLRTAWTDSPVVAGSTLHTIQFLHDRITYLSDLPPSTATQTPYVGKSRTPGLNRNINDEPLMHLGRRHIRGIGTASRSTLTWNLKGELKSFHSSFGIDQSAPKGAAEFRIQVDGKTVFTKVTRTSDGLSRTPVIPINGARTLTLTVDYGPRGDIHDVANWIDPVLVH